MVNFKPFLKILHLPTKFRLKLKLGVLLLSLTLLSNYQPAINFPPIKKNLVYAEIAQQPSIEPQDLGLVFQLPHAGYITTTFSTYHPGIDLCSGLGMPIKPIAKGKVTSAGFNYFGLGLVVEVDHGNGYSSLYAHMGKIFVEKGKEVSADDYLGEIGMTGHTSGPHTHLEVSKDNKRINPLLILPEIRKYPTENDFVEINSSTPSAITIPKVSPSTISAQIRPAQVTLVIETNLVKQGNQTEKGVEVVKSDLKQQSLNNVLNLATHKPSTSPLPQGGKISLKNFSFYGFKKN